MQKPPFTTVVRRQLGRRLRRFRDMAGMTPVDVARAKIAHRTKLWRYEGGLTTVRGGDVMAMCHLYDIDHNTTNELVRMADASSERNYLEYNGGKGVEERYWMHADLERISTAQCQYSAELVPGLLQTPAYMRAVIAANTTLSRETVDLRVVYRMRRQERFFGRDEPCHLEILMPASALNLVVGSPETMAEQVAHLVAADDRDEVSIRILPGLHGHMYGSFTIMDFDNPDAPAVVCLFEFIGSQYIERPEQVAKYREVVGMLRKQAVPLKECLRERANPVDQGAQELG